MIQPRQPIRVWLHNRRVERWRCRVRRQLGISERELNRRLAYTRSYIKDIVP